MTIWKVSIAFDWMDGDDCAHYSFGSLEGAEKKVAAWVERGDVVWYSIEENAYLPCNENDPDGQLYIGCDYFEFREIKKEDAENDR